MIHAHVSPFSPLVRVHVGPHRALQRRRQRPDRGRFGSRTPTPIVDLNDPTTGPTAENANLLIIEPVTSIPVSTVC